MNDARVLEWELEAESIPCRQCDARFAGDRTAARRAGWEPWSTSNQRDLDHGPMVCRDCVQRILAEVLEALHGTAL